MILDTRMCHVLAMEPEPNSAPHMNIGLNAQRDGRRTITGCFSRANKKDRRMPNQTSYLTSQPIVQSRRQSIPEISTWHRSGGKAIWNSFAVNLVI
jgi:hypothetical protein